MPKVQITGDRIEYNGFLVGRFVASAPASVKTDFRQHVTSVEKRSWEAGYDAGRASERDFQSSEV
jgi:hypothetical protein